jgi:RNA polymerase sigma-70 factor (ECF subfamily)
MIYIEENGMTYAIGDLIQKRLPHWLAYAQSLTRNRTAAEDLVQDTVVRVLTSAERFDGRSFASWSNTILRNRFIDEYRRSRFQDASVVDLEGTVTAREASQEIKVELDETLRALDRLSPKHRRVLVLTCVQDLSYVHAARRLKIPLGTVRSRLSRARKELAAALDGKDGGGQNGAALPNPVRSPRRSASKARMPQPERSNLLAA